MNIFRTKFFWFTCFLSFLLLIVCYQTASFTANSYRPYILNAQNVKNGVNLTFSANPDTEYDIPNPNKIALFRRLPSSDLYPDAPIASFTEGSTLYFIDTSATINESYFYIIREKLEDNTYQFSSNEVYIKRSALITTPTAIPITQTSASKKPITSPTQKPAISPTSTPKLTTKRL